MKKLISLLLPKEFASFKMLVCLYLISFIFRNHITDWFEWMIRFAIICCIVEMVVKYRTRKIMKYNKIMETLIDDIIEVMDEKGKEYEENGNEHKDV